MHPGFSVIFLTTLIGAGQGLFLAIFGIEIAAANLEIMVDAKESLEPRLQRLRYETMPFDPGDRGEHSEVGDSTIDQLLFDHAFASTRKVHGHSSPSCPKAENEG